MRKLLFLVAIAGLLVSGYLYVGYTEVGPIPCPLSGGCEVVRASQYAQFFGLPTPLYGVVFYLLLALGALLLPRYRAALRIPLLVLTGIGLAVSLYLSYLEAYVVRAWCTWCVVSAVLTVIAFGLAWATLGVQNSRHEHRN